MELSLGSMMAAESSTMPVDVGSDPEDTGLAECVWDWTKE